MFVCFFLQEALENEEGGDSAQEESGAVTSSTLDNDGEGSRTDESRNVIRGPIASRRGRGRGRGRGKFQAFGKSNTSNS